MTKEEYAKLLKDPRWKLKRDKIIKRDKNTCIRCGDTKYLQVHHLIYKNTNPWEYDDNDLITLCRNCHKSIHYKKEKIIVMGNLSRTFYEETGITGNEKALLTKNKVTIVGSSKTISNIESIEDCIKDIFDYMTTLRDNCMSMTDKQKSGTIKIQNQTIGDIEIDIAVSLSYKVTPMSEKKRAEMLSTIENLKQKNTEY